MNWAEGPDSHEKYNRYLASREWSVKTRAVRERCKNVCERCRRHRVDAVHHLTYIRKYRELLEDLQGICKPCHDFNHSFSDVDPSKAPAPKPAPKPTPVTNAPAIPRVVVPTPPAPSSPRLLGRKIKSVYLAGKITGTSWRSEIAPGWCSSGEDRGSGVIQVDDGWWVVEGAVPVKGHSALDLTGPFWRECCNCSGHCSAPSCPQGYHGDGVVSPLSKGYWGLGTWEVDLQDLKGRIFQAIDDCDLLFAWIDCLDCFGTLAEIGYARGKGKRIVIAKPYNFNVFDLWLPSIMGDVFVDALSPADAWDRMWRSGPASEDCCAVGGDVFLSHFLDESDFVNFEDHDDYIDNLEVVDMSDVLDEYIEPREASMDPYDWEIAYSPNYQIGEIGFEKYPEIRNRLLQFV